MNTSFMTTAYKYTTFAGIVSLLFLKPAVAADFSGSLKGVTITDALQENKPPVAQFTSSVAGNTVTLNAAGSSDSDGTISEYKWNFGDGATATGVTATHQFSQNAVAITLTVTDNKGGVAIKQANLTLITEPFEIIVDDATTASFATVGTWSNSTYSPDYYGTGYKFSNKGDGSAKAVWTASIPASGNYTLYVYKSASGTSRSAKAPFSIENNAVSMGTVLVNQQVGSREFFSIGTFQLQKGTASITLASAPDGYVIADAVKFTYNP